jgi:hypothetical protein
MRFIWVVLYMLILLYLTIRPLSEIRWWWFFFTEVVPMLAIVWAVWYETYRRGR